MLELVFGYGIGSNATKAFRCAINLAKESLGQFPPGIQKHCESLLLMHPPCSSWQAAHLVAESHIEDAILEGEEVLCIPLSHKGGLGLYLFAALIPAFE